MAAMNLVSWYLDLIFLNFPVEKNLQRVTF